MRMHVPALQRRYPLSVLDVDDAGNALGGVTFSFHVDAVPDDAFGSDDVEATMDAGTTGGSVHGPKP